MACCSCESPEGYHDYCCVCYTEKERARRIVQDVLDGTYEGDERSARGNPYVPTEIARVAATAIVAVLKHERVI